MSRVHRVLPEVTAIRYVAPLREGGSLPGVVEADDLGTYVAKFVGAGQGVKALAAEVITGELGRRIGLRVPRLVRMAIDPVIGRAEPDEEVQDLLRASGGINLGVDFLPGAIGFDPFAHHIEPVEASTVLWLDAFTQNVDRSWRNPNLLIWHRQLWLIDHGAALYFHHGWSRPGADPSRFARQPYDASDHVLVAYAGGVPEADRALAPLVDRQLLTEVLEQVPDEWLEPDGDGDGPAVVRRRYLDYLLARLAGERNWLPGAVAA
jgi:HipA-like protein